MRQVEWCLQTMRRGMNEFLMRVALLSLSFEKEISLYEKKAAPIKSNAYGGYLSAPGREGRGLQWRAA